MKCFRDNFEGKAAILNLLSKYPELDETPLKWFREKKSQDKSFYFESKFCSLNHNALLSRFLSDRAAMFTQAVGMTASDWSVSDIVKTRQTIILIFHKNCCFSVSILRLKAKCLLKNCAVYSQIYIEFQLLHFFGCKNRLPF